MDKVYSNIFYFKRICKIGGTEQFLYEIAKKNYKYDITIFYDEGDYNQLKRLRKYVRVKKRNKGEIIKCKKAFLNFNIDIIEDIEAEEIYFVSHAIYQELGYKPPIENKKINNCIAVSDYANMKLKEYAKKIGKEINAITCYNPLTLEKVKKPKILVSACRLNDKTKGGERTLKLIEALDRYCNKNGEHYIWLIFSNNVKANITSPNIILMKPTVDVRSYIAMADYVVQLSNDMETYCYTINEALGYGVPIITTPLSVIKELPITDDEKIELNWNCDNIDDVAKQIFEKEVKTFEYKPPKDDWNKILVKDKSTYKEEQDKKVKVKIKKNYYDNELEKHLTINSEPIEMTLNRAEELINHPKGALVEII